MSSLDDKMRRQSMRRILRASPEPKFRKVSSDPSRALGGCRWRGKLPIPVHCHPLVRLAWVEMNRQQMTLAEVASEAGVGRTTMWNWAKRNEPKIGQIEAVLNVLGLRLTVEDMPE